MIEERVRYGIDNFLQENYFLPENHSYCLEEKSESGRSELQVKVRGDNLCIEDYDHKGKCNFFRNSSEFKLKRSVDHIVLQKKEGKWVVHLIEMKSKIDNKKWREIKQKIRASYFNICALERVLGIHIEEVKTYTTYENVDFWEIKRTPDLKGFAIPLGKRALSEPENEWNKSVINVDVGEMVMFEHNGIQMNRTTDSKKLIGELEIG